MAKKRIIRETIEALERASKVIQTVEDPATRTALGIINNAFLIHMRDERKIQDAIVFAHSREELEAMKQNPTPHYVGFQWSDVDWFIEISRSTMRSLVENGKADYADI